MRMCILSIALTLSACVHSNDCNNPLSNTELQECSQQELTTQKELLKKTTFSVSKIIPNPADLFEANKIWEEYSNTHCHSAARIYEGGSNFNAAVTMCLINQVKNRKKAIEKDYSDAINIISNGSP